MREVDSVTHFVDFVYEFYFYYILCGHKEEQNRTHAVQNVNVFVFKNDIQNGGNDEDNSNKYAVIQ